MNMTRPVETSIQAVSALSKVAAGLTGGAAGSAGGSAARRVLLASTTAARAANGNTRRIKDGSSKRRVRARRTSNRGEEAERWAKGKLDASVKDLGWRRR